MLSDEEKKAIEKIRSFNQYNWEMNNLKEKEFAKPYFDALDTILNLIEKQSKEIEELKEKNKTLKSLQNDTNGLYIEMTERKNYFERELQKVEDKIKAKIEELIKEGNYRTADNPNGRVHFQKKNYRLSNRGFAITFRKGVETWILKY